MFLDDLERCQEFDPEGMFENIDGLPDQIEAAWQHAQNMPLPKIGNVNQIVICGMGGSAIGGALLQTLLVDECTLPIIIQRDYQLPAFVGSDTLLIGSSYSGNTEETIEAFREAHRRDATLVSFSTGGHLADLSSDFVGTHWEFDYRSQPRAAIGYSIMLPLALLSRLDLVRAYSPDVAEAVDVMRSQQVGFRREAPVEVNPAKHLAGQMLERFVLVLAADPLASVARRWRGQIAENAKAWAEYEELPEVNHNSVAGLEHPEALTDRMMVVFLESSLSHPRNQRRTELTRQMFIQAGYNTDAISAKGESRLAQMLSVLHYGDYSSYYLAIAYGVNPTPVKAISWFKDQLSQGI